MVKCHLITLFFQAQFLQTALTLRLIYKSSSSVRTDSRMLIQSQNMDVFPGSALCSAFIQTPNVLQDRWGFFASRPLTWTFPWRQVLLRMTSFWRWWSWLAPCPWMTFVRPCWPSPASFLLSLSCSTVRTQSSFWSHITSVLMLMIIPGEWRNCSDYFVWAANWLLFLHYCFFEWLKTQFYTLVNGGMYGVFFEFDPDEGLSQSLNFMEVWF